LHISIIHLLHFSSSHYFNILVPEYSEVEKMERQEAAAIKIQSGWRGHLARQKVKLLKSAPASAMSEFIVQINIISFIILGNHGEAETKQQILSDGGN
jgi:hypothetical protein